jgi:hypothetical protein
MVSKLTSLLVDEKAADEELIASILEPYIRIGKDSGMLIPTTGFQKVTVKNKLLLYCIGRKAAKIAGTLREDEAIKLEPLASRLNVPLDVLRVTASRLKTKGILDRNKDGYFISTATLLNAKAELEDGYKTHKKSKKVKK